jgi:hypothetical protein
MLAGLLRLCLEEASEDYPALRTNEAKTLDQRSALAHALRHGPMGAYQTLREAVAAAYPPLPELPRGMGK